jgi:hypothetical protein
MHGSLLFVRAPEIPDEYNCTLTIPTSNSGYCISHEEDKTCLPIPPQVSLRGLMDFYSKAQKGLSIGMLR